MLSCDKVVTLSIAQPTITFLCFPVQSGLITLCICKYIHFQFSWSEISTEVLFIFNTFTSWMAGKEAWKLQTLWPIVNMSTHKVPCTLLLILPHPKENWSHHDILLLKYDSNMFSCCRRTSPKKHSIKYTFPTVATKLTYIEFISFKSNNCDLISNTILSELP